MTDVEIWALAVALAMDCLAVSLTSGMIMQRIRWKSMLAMAFSFGFFQALNPVIGWLCTNQFRTLIENADHWIAFGVLAFLGGRMIAESFKKEDEKTFDPTSTKVILTMSVATSIDALAVGISFSCIGIRDFSHLIYPVSAIGIVSFVLSLAGLLAGIKFGKGFSEKIKPDLCGGIILILIGTRILLEHLGILQ